MDANTNLTPAGFCPNGTDIDNRWLDLAGQRRREIAGINQAITDLTNQLATKQRQLAAAEKGLAEVKAAIAARAAFPEPEQKAAATPQRVGITPAVDPK